MGAQQREGIVSSDPSEGSWLARELHDAVCSRLTEMLVEMELLRRREGAPPELGQFQRQIRDALICVRQLLRELRQLPPTDAATTASALEHKIRGATSLSGPASSTPLDNDAAARDHAGAGPMR